MGCDIHFYLEKRQKDGTWISADNWSENEYYQDDPEHERKLVANEVYNSRNYNLFSILADVRNGRGFAECDTGDGFIPISDPKGLPPDVSGVIKDLSESWGSDGHSHSYFNLTELLNYDWTQTTKHRGWVNGFTYAEYLRKIKFEDLGIAPDCWCGEVSGPDIKKMSCEELKKIIEDVKATEKYQSSGHKDQEDILLKETGQSYCQLEWESPYYMSVRGEFWWKTIPIMAHIADGELDSVRTVFWFDN